MKKILPVIVIVLVFSGCSGGESGVYVVKLSPPDMIEQFKLGQIDGFVAWEPFVSKGVKSGGKILLNSKDIWQDHPCCVIASSQHFNDESALKSVLYAHIKATKFINNPENREKVVEYAKEFTGLEKGVVEEALDNIEFIVFPDEKEFRKYYEYLNSSGILRKNIRDLGFADEDEFFTAFLKKDLYQEVLDDISGGRVPKYEGTVRIGYLAADLHQLALFVAVKEGYLEETGMDFELKQYKNGIAVMEAFKANEIDVAYLGGAPATLRRINDGIGVTIIAGANNEGSAIVVRQDISSVEDLKGKTIAIPGYGTVQDFLLRLVAEEHGLKVISK
jgi:NitT/TauT family transport system substrate-binding protein